MTMHVYSRWELEHSADDCPVAKLAQALKHNRRKDSWLPGAFAILSSGDALYFVLGSFLNAWGEPLQTTDDVARFVSFAGECVDLDAPNREAMLDVCRKVCTKYVEDLS